MPVVRIVLVVNAGSGGGADPTALADMLRAEGADVDLHVFADLADIPLDGVDRLVVAAGDGGVGSAAVRAAAAGIPLGVLPSGTANDFAGFLQIPPGPEAAAVVAAAPNAPTRRLDIAFSGRTPFLNAAACGLSAAAGEHAGPLKRLLGAAAYAVGALRAGVTERACSYRVIVDGEAAFDGPAWQVIVSGTGAFGGGSEIEAVPDDGQLDVTVVRGSRRELPLRAWGMRQGGLHRQKDVLHLIGREVVVEGADSWNVDGELLDYDDAGTFRIEGHVDVIVPRESKGSGPFDSRGG